MRYKLTHIKAWILSAFLICSTWGTLNAQHSSIAGRVIDAENGEPIPGVNVFLAQSTRGTTSDANGEYTIDHLSSGPYEVIVSIIGYKSESQSIEIGADRSNRVVDFRLSSEVYDLGPIEVAAQAPRKWKRRLRTFEKYFLGESRSADATEILNPFALSFESAGGVLTARASEPITMENTYLGYRVTFMLDRFRFDQSLQTLQYDGNAYYEELTPVDEEQGRDWVRNRENTYYGSVQHLLWSVINNRTKEEGFTLKIDKRINAPASQDIPDFELTDAKEFVELTDTPSKYRISFNHYLYVTYQNRNAKFSFRLRNREPDRQISWISMHSGQGYIHENGSVYSPGPLRIHGYLNTKRIADRLPVDYIESLQRSSTTAPGTPLASSASGSSYDTVRASFPQESNWLISVSTASMEPVVELMKKREWKKAIDILDSLVDEDPGYLEARYYRGIANREMAKFHTLAEFEHWQNGINDFKYILSKDSTFNDVLYQYALYCRVPLEQNKYRDQNIRFADAIRMGHEQIRLRPDLPEQQYNLFSLYSRFVRNTRSQDALNWLREDSSSHSKYFEGVVLAREGQLKEAGLIYESLLNDSQTFPVQPILLSLARLRYEQREPMIAEAYLEKAINEISHPLHAAFVFNDFKYIVNNQELETYQTLRSPDQFIQFFHALWARRDPMPAFEHNVRLEEHYRRLAVAEQDYTYDGYKLWLDTPEQGGQLDFPAPYFINDRFNDKGLIYIRHGEPDERISTVSPGISDNFNTSLGIAGKKSVFGPKEQSYRATWVPNESWKYQREDFTYHFVIAEGASGNNWRLTSSLTNIDMLEDRMHWGGSYLQMAKAAQQADEQRLSSNNPAFSEANANGRFEEFDDQNNQAASLDMNDFLDMETGREVQMEASKLAVQTGLQTDRHTWADTLESFSFPVIATAFRGSKEGYSDLLLHMALPANMGSGNDQPDSLRYEVGVALHDTLWTERLNDRTIFSIPAQANNTTASVHSIEFSVPPEDYHIALHSQLQNSPKLGAYSFTKEIPNYDLPELSISDLLIAYSITPTSDEYPINRSQLKIVPNPFQRVEIKEPFHLYYEIYNLTYGADDQTSYSISYSIETESQARKLLGLGRKKDAAVLSIETSGESVSSSPIEYAQIDVSNIEPGRYILSVEIVDNNTGIATQRMAQIEIYER